MMDDESNKKHDSEKERKLYEEALQRVNDRLRRRENRAFYDYVRRMGEENKHLRRRADRNLSRNSDPGPPDRTRCPKCKDTGLMQCHVCDGLGTYLGRDDRIVTCARCYGKKRIPCTQYGCRAGAAR